MDDKQKKFLDSRIAECKSHSDWLTVVSFGLGTLLEDQNVLIELITEEARRLVENDEGRLAGRGEMTQGATVLRILNELGLKLTVTTPAR